MSEYIMDLCKIVGHRTLIQVGASVIVEDSEGKILLQKRADTHTWAYAGGSVEIDESVEDTARRELFEETGLVAEELELLGVYSGKHMHNIYPNGNETSNVDIVYVCRKYSGQLKCQEKEVLELKFFSIEEMPGEIFMPNVPAIEEWRRRKNDYNGK